MGYRAAQFRGDYRAFGRGDGFLSSAFGAIKKGVTGAVRSIVTGGNPIAGAIAGITNRQTAVPVSYPGTSIMTLPGTSIAPMQPGTRMVTAGGGMVGVSPLGTVGATSGRGMHPNRTTYYTAGGRVEKGTRLVRNRHTNYGNSRALVRALRRAHGFQHLARAVMSFTMTGKKHGPAHFKARRRGK